MNTVLAFLRPIMQSAHGHVELKPVHREGKEYDKCELMLSLHAPSLGILVIKGHRIQCCHIMTKEKQDMVFLTTKNYFFKAQSFGIYGCHFCYSGSKV